MQFKLPSKKIRNISLDKWMVYIIFVFVFLIFAILLGNQGFLSGNNIMNVLRQTAVISIVSVGGTFILACGEIDLTVGAVAAMTAMFVSLILQATNSILLAVVAGLAFGVIVGTINGLLVTKLRIPAFLATMGMQQIIRGGAMWITDTAAVPIENRTFTYLFGAGQIGPIPVLLIWTIVIYIIGVLLFNKSIFGRHLLATGGNEVSARYSGVETKKIKVSAFVISALLAALGGILYAGRLSAGRYSYGEGDEMSVIAAVVLGGTAMTGGTGSMIGSLVGSILIGFINNALILANLSSAQQTMVKGAIIVLSVALSNIAQGKKKQV